MTLLKWNDSFSVNIQAFDAQHHKLIGMINELHEAMRVGQGKQALQKILAGLVDYTQTHFAAEEKLMLAHNYPGYLAHKAEHDALTKKVLELQAQYQADEIVLALPVMEFLKDWLTHHILNTDKKYGPYLNRKGIQ